MILQENIGLEQSSEENTSSTQEEDLPELGVGAKEYYLVGRISDDTRAQVEGITEVHAVIQRLSVNLKRVLRKLPFADEHIFHALEKKSLIYRTREDMFEQIERARAGIGITGGGDCAGIADCLSTMIEDLDRDMVMLGVRNAGKGLSVDPSDFEDQLVILDRCLADDFKGQASTPFGSSRVDPLNSAPENFAANLDGFKFFYGTGGNDHLGLLERISNQFPDMTVVGTFKSIDGDGCVDGKPAQMLGFVTAAKDYQKSIWSVAQSAAAHEQVSVIEVFGRDSGKLAFEAERRDPHNFELLNNDEQRKILDLRDTVVILVPEQAVSLRKVAEKVEEIKDEEGSAVVVVAEGFLPPELKEEMSRLSKNNTFRAQWFSGNLQVEAMPYLIKHEGKDGPKKDLAEILKNKRLASEFAEILWESKRDAFGNGIKLSGIRHFIIQAIKEFTEIEKVNEVLQNYEARGASPSLRDIVMGRKIGKKMAEVVNSGEKGGHAVLYFEEMNAFTEDPVVVPLDNVTDENNLNHSDVYSDEILSDGGVLMADK